MEQKLQRNKEQSIKWAGCYWIGTMLQIGIVCLFVACFRTMGISKKSIDLAALIIGGTSSALWGILISKWSGRIKSYKMILKDFFNIRQLGRHYMLLVLFLFIIFGKQIIFGQTAKGFKWYLCLLIFLQSILFGGIEEIGWRYTFQLQLEKVFSFPIASIATFISWGIWHYMYFYITRTLSSIHHIIFLMGLLESCFILGALYKVSNSLWLCVCYHAILNMFSQTLLPATLLQTIMTTCITIIIALVVVGKRPIRQLKYKRNISD